MSLTYNKNVADSRKTLVPEIIKETAICVYDSETFNSESLTRNIDGYDFALSPRFAPDKLREIKEIALRPSPRLAY